MSKGLNRKKSVVAMDYLRRRHPEFFQCPEKQALAAIIIREIGEEIGRLDPVSQTSIVAGIMSLQYRMGTAALKSIRDPQERSMTEIFIESDKHEQSQRMPQTDGDPDPSP